MILRYPEFTAPQQLAPIVVVGAGGIVRDGHLPAYRLAGFSVAGVYDRDRAKAEEVARQFTIPRVFGSLEAAVEQAPGQSIFDVAVPASALPEVLEGLPDGAAVLMQKPFGENLDQARALRALVDRKCLRAAVNFQLRDAPCIRAARQLIADGAIGELHDMEVRVTVYMPWQLWTFLDRAPRVEIVYHSIHYVDLIRSFLGEPSGVHAKTVKHPITRHLEATRTTMSLDYGDMLRATVTTNHGHVFGRKHQESYVKWEGTRGALKARLGLLLDYPKGEADTLELCRLDSRGKPGDWESVPVNGNWYPHAFMGPMSALMRHATGETNQLPPTRTEDAFRTMAVVEAAYESSATGGTPIPRE